MNRIVTAVIATACAAAAHANPALHGTWSAASVNGQPLTVTFAPDGTGKVNGTPMQWQAMGKLLFVQMQGAQAVGYSWELKDGKLNVAGGDLQATAILSRGKLPDNKKSSPVKTAGSGQELAGKWCNLAQMNANRGGSSRMECFQLNPDGSYTYNYEGSMSGSTGGTASQSSDAGRWRYDGARLTAQSRSGKTNSYALEKRNHPKNKRDPMICLDGTCYVTYYNKPAW